MLQLQELCRLCAQKKRNKLNLFTNNNEKEATDLLKKIAICLSVQVTREDTLPKMICTDCLKSVEQFNVFRLKCQKAEERLHKMLSSVIPNTIMVPIIKEEYLETDVYDNCDSDLRRSELVTNTNLKSFKNVKVEVEEIHEAYDSSKSDLIQIISEEIVNQSFDCDIKQPQIEIISENFRDEPKQVDIYEIDHCNESMLNNNDTICDIKVTPEFEANMSSCELINYVEIKEPVFESDGEPEVNAEKTKAKNRISSKTKKRTRKNDGGKKSGYLINSDTEIEDKYFVLAEGETCDIDLEEMEAVIKKKQDPNIMFQCNKCDKSFKFFKSLKKHRNCHNSEPNFFFCDICKESSQKNYKFSNLKTLKTHILKTHLLISKNKFECEICHKIFQSQDKLIAHRTEIHESINKNCRICNKVFKNKVSLNNHLKVHSNEKHFVCDTCGQLFKWKNALKVHIQHHKQEKNFLCAMCGKKFTAKKNLTEHLNIHTNKRPFVCQYCDATFVQLSAYSRHLHVHNKGNNIHKCDKCERTFSHACLLRQHLLRHTGVRPYECPTCHGFYKSQSDLWSHVKSHQEKKYRCQVCETKFALPKTLRDHMVLHTGIKHSCPVPGCGKLYTQRYPLTKHFRKQHPSLSIIKKRKGRKVFKPDKEFPVSNFIHYDFQEKIVQE